ncbi:GAF domain-containing protein [Chroococcus sp. FPU101]|uniref:GAF domain-containing protein n=1 Tax=Chroococcus sp. FPU101 TaxID=1974212 RepID=UPI001A8D93EA|nr:GAF domain-containing protein [Chroococcus sp. FPU101]GFE70382.1 methyl-accepting chemotaxis sensory transducer with GAF sensor [Chroococcus sp. FPU101]
MNTSKPYSLSQKFADLPIQRKTQLITLLIFLSLAGIPLLGAKVLEGSLRSQLQNQIKTQLAVTELNYNNQIENMEVSFAAVANNLTVIEAARLKASGQPLPPNLTQALKDLLRQEIKIQNLDYATLVSPNLEIIASGNPSTRTGEKFNPNQLVSSVLKQPRQLSTSEIVPWQDFQKEGTERSKNLTNQDALIRYTLTPVKTSDNGKVIGVLVAGNIVNAKKEIVQKTLNTYTDDGYTAIYQRYGNGKFALASSLEKNELRQSNFDIPLADQTLLKQAINAKNKVISGTGTIGQQTYHLAAKALPNSKGEAVAVLVYGDPETALKRVMNASLLTQGLLSGLMLCFVPLLAWGISRSITRPIKRLQQITAEFADGEYKARANIDSQDEVGQLASNFNEMADNIVSHNQYLEEQAEMFRFLSRLSLPEQLDETRLDPFLTQALKEARQIIKANRLLIYRITNDGRGSVTHEARELSCPSALTQRIEDTFPQELLAAYRQERIFVINDIEHSEQKSHHKLHPAHERLLQQLQVKACVILPIMNEDDLFGLLIAHRDFQKSHQCDSTREWQETEINFLKQLSSHLQVIHERVNSRRRHILDSRLAMRLKDLTRQIARSQKDEDLYQTVVSECRRAMQVDRVIVYRFDANWMGTVIAESVDDRYPVALNARIGDPCFAEKYVEKYRQGRVVATPDIYQANLTTCHLQQLEPFAVKANLVTPIIIGNELFGLLIAHQCRGIKYWEDTEIDFLSQIATQIGVALERSQLLLTQASVALQQRQAKEQLQQRAIELLIEVDPVRQGDLTIRATVTEDEIGTIADSYNAIVESLRHIVTQVQSTTHQLASSTNDSEQTIFALSQQADQQVEEIESTVDHVESMMGAIAQVTTNAQLALATVEKTLNTVEASEAVMNQTVEGMIAIRDTVTHTAEKVSNLGESSKKISKVVNLISRFAAQTHLLALKASIEAARAGEEGRGFAVIADEVRMLATQSAEASAEIEAIVDSISLLTREVAATMETGTEQVAVGSQLLDETRHTLSQIIAASQEIGQLVEAIAKSAQQQSETGGSVRATMTEVATISHKTLKSAQTVANSIEHVLQTTQNLSSSVGQFKV